MGLRRRISRLAPSVGTGERIHIEQHPLRCRLDLLPEQVTDVERRIPARRAAGTFHIERHARHGVERLQMPRHRLAHLRWQVAHLHRRALSVHATTQRARR